MSDGVLLREKRVSDVDDTVQNQHCGKKKKGGDVGACLPSSARPAVVREGVADPGVDVVQAQLPLRGSRYRHGDEGGVAVRGFPFTV